MSEYNQYVTAINKTANTPVNLFIINLQNKVYNAIYLTFIAL